MSHGAFQSSFGHLLLRTPEMRRNFQIKLSIEEPVGASYRAQSARSRQFVFQLWRQHAQECRRDEPADLGCNT